MTSINSYKYMFNYLDSNKLNELLYRFDNKDIASDIQTLIDNDAVLSKEHIVVTSKIVTTYDDIYGIILFKKKNIQLGHFTIHFLPGKTQTQYIGPIHYKNNSNNNLGTRINISPSYNNNISKPIKLNFVNATNRNLTYKSPNRLINRIADKVKQVLNLYFDDTSNNTTSMSLQNPYYNYSNTIPHKRYSDLVYFYINK